MGESPAQVRYCIVRYLLMLFALYFPAATGEYIFCMEPLSYSVFDNGFFVVPVRML